MATWRCAKGYAVGSGGFFGTTYGGVNRYRELAIRGLAHVSQNAQLLSHNATVGGPSYAPCPKAFARIKKSENPT